MIRGSRLYEVLERCGVRSAVDPLMGVPVHLSYLKSHGIAVHGGDVFEWPVQVGNGIVVNDAAFLRDEDVAAIVEMLPGRVYALDVFTAWEGTLFSHEQCRYLAVWRDNVRALRSDAHVGLAVLGLWRVFCYWIQKTQMPDAMEDVAPGDLAWHYLRQTPPWLATNGQRNTVRCADPIAIVQACSADALVVDASSAETSGSDARAWMWEAWWRGDPHFKPDPPSHGQALGQLVARSESYRIVLVVTTARAAPEAEELLRSSRRSVEAVSTSAGEVYLIASSRRFENAPR